MEEHEVLLFNKSDVYFSSLMKRIIYGKTEYACVYDYDGHIGQWDTIFDKRSYRSVLKVFYKVSQISNVFFFRNLKPNFELEQIRTILKECMQTNQLFEENVIDFCILCYVQEETTAFISKKSSKLFLDKLFKKMYKLNKLNLEF